jgi:hypothetical protein
MDKTIEDLKKYRSSLSLRIRKRVVQNKNAYDLVVEYTDITNKLLALGCKVSVETDHLKIENWTEDGYKLTPTRMKLTPKEVQKSQKKRTKSTPTKKEKTNTITPKQDSFILCLAWTEVDGAPEPVQLQKVKDYFYELCLPILDTETRKVTDTLTEHVLKYEFKGTEDAFRLLKVCTQFVLDAFAQTDFDRFNIAIFGKKKAF